MSQPAHPLAYNSNKINHIGLTGQKYDNFFEKEHHPGGQTIRVHEILQELWRSMVYA